jgi:hypothetical protein
MVDDKRREGKIIFEKQSVREEWDVFWEPRAGEVVEGQNWKAVVSFDRDWTFPTKVKDWIYEYLSGDEVSIFLMVDGQRAVKCNALFEPDDLEEFNLWGVIPLGSIDMGRPYLRSETN